MNPLGAGRAPGSSAGPPKDFVGARVTRSVYGLLQTGATNVTTDGSVGIAVGVIVVLLVGLVVLRRWTGGSGDGA